MWRLWVPGQRRVKPVARRRPSRLHSPPVKSAFPKYLAERFPVGPYSVLIAAMLAGITAASCDGAGRPLTFGVAQLAAFLTLLLGFFHLRVFDEHKDYDKDLVAHPDRVLSRGLITLRELRVAGGVAIALEFGLNAPFGFAALGWVTAFVLFSVAMRYEFGVGAWLNRHLVVYALTHNPIVALMMLYAASVSSGALTSGPVLGFVGVATFTSLGFEVGRKLRAPDDEKTGQDTYTAALGIPGAVFLLIVVLWGAGGAATFVAQTLWGRSIVSVAGLFGIVTAVMFASQQTRKAAKLAETGSTLAALIMYVTIAADVAARRGILWS